MESNQGKVELGNYLVWLSTYVYISSVTSIEKLVRLEYAILTVTWKVKEYEELQTCSLDAYNKEKDQINERSMKQKL